MKTVSKLLLGTGAAVVLALGVAHADGWGWHGWQRGGPGWGGPGQMGQMGQASPMGPMMRFGGSMLVGPGGMRAQLMERLDANKDGAVTLEEFTNRPNEAFAAADTNKDGVIDKSEADAFILKMLEPMRDRMFARFDLNGDGKITKDELDSPIKKRFALFDRNDDGKVTKEELAAVGPGYGPGFGGPGYGPGPRGHHGHRGWGNWYGGPAPAQP
jgi:Ca2+-binding EF-hand superfamily protein